MSIGLSCFSPVDAQKPDAEKASTSDLPANAAESQAKFMTEIRQLTFEGRRAGEGYFSKDGKQMVFQSEREPGNPFFQIYLMDRESGDVHRVSPGKGKTTCAWISPAGDKVLYASTQYDQHSEAKQASEYELRNSPNKPRYSWDYDPEYELVEFDVKTHEYRKVTNAEGYDAEGSYSPDGKWICFASNRRAYTNELSDEEKELFKLDPASAMELYIMRADGSELKRLTTSIGYDGGPFFSPDGAKICWRRFTKDGATAEIMVMNRDGSDQRAVTKLGAMSWAPFFHPSGEYLIFTTNRHGFANFELYMVDVNGEREPVRVTYRDGFDGLPVFTPDGKQLVWTSNGGTPNSQLWEASWNHDAARDALQVNSTTASTTETADSLAQAAEAKQTTAPGFSPADVGRHVDYLCRPELGGRLTGTPGELKATAYVAAYLESLGFKPAGQNGSFFHEFEFTSDVKLGKNNQLHLGDKAYQVDRDWRPVFFSKGGVVEPKEVVFAGYGIVAPKDGDEEEYDSYVHLDIRDKWVLVYRQMPQGITPKRRQALARYSDLRYKAMVARDRGAAGLIVVSGPTSQARNQLVPLNIDGTLGTSSIAVISVTDAVASEWFKLSELDLAEEQKSLDSGEMAMGIEMPKVKLSAQIDVEPVASRGRNVLALLPAGKEATREMVVVGAHIDHLGNGKGGSLAREDEIGGTHRGADDNASGVGSMLEIAQYLASEQASGKLNMKRDVLIAAWSGEELGLRGSQAFADDFAELYPNRMPANPHAAAGAASDDAVAAAHAHAAQSSAASLYPQIAACLNLDMVGRLRENLILQGLGSSPYWTGAIERRNAVVKLPLTLQNDCHLPTDASTFFLHGVPILAAFTGSHSEYHTPRDTPELLNYEGAAQIAKLMALIARDLVQAETSPEYQEQAAQPEMRANLTAYLGTVPDYGKGDIKGVSLSGVTKGAPADKAGMRGGDIIIELAGKKIENIYDYTFAIEALKVGEAIKAKVKRGTEEIELDLVPASRQ
ncbi:MAG: M28 family peptidase [Pirellulaceae bacterium]|nr:M28 family peptidase [Pirellulaceae bacterium]